MPQLPELNRVRLCLLNRGVPLTYVRRLLEELSEHRTDLLEDLTARELNSDAAAAEAQQRIGDAGAIADAAVAGLRYGSFTGRHPALSLIALPLLLLPLCWLAFFVTSAWLLAIAGGSGWLSATSSEGRMTVVAVCYFCGYGLHALIGVPFYWSARRACCGTTWAWMPCLALSAVAAFSFFHLTFNDAAGTGHLIAGVSPSPDKLKLFLALTPVLLLELKREADFRRWMRAPA
jgi:hypothetical protein